MVPLPSLWTTWSIWLGILWHSGPTISTVRFQPSKPFAPLISTAFLVALRHIVAAQGRACVFILDQNWCAVLKVCALHPVAKALLAVLWSSEICRLMALPMNVPAKVPLICDLDARKDFHWFLNYYPYFLQLSSVCRFSGWLHCSALELDHFLAHLGTKAGWCMHGVIWSPLTDRNGRWDDKISLL